MAVFRIPVSDTYAWYQMSIVLSSVRYLLEMRYNVRMQRWALNIKNTQGTAILMGIPLLNLRDPLAQYRTLAIPQGSITAYDNTGQDNPPSLGSFLTSSTLYYVDDT